MATDTIYGHKLSITSGEVIDTKYNLKVSDGYKTVVSRSNKIDRSYDLCGIKGKKNAGPPESIQGTIKVVFKPTENGPLMKRLKNGPLSSISVNSFYEKPSKLPAKNTAKKAIKAKAANKVCK